MTDSVFPFAAFHWSVTYFGRELVITIIQCRSRKLGRRRPFVSYATWKPYLTSPFSEAKNRQVGHDSLKYLDTQCQGAERRG